jgi:hypothetical protein
MIIHNKSWEAWVGGCLLDHGTTIASPASGFSKCLNAILGKDLGAAKSGEAGAWLELARQDAKI